MGRSDPGAVTAIFETYRDDVYQWALKVLGSHHDALDTVQEVFLKWFSQARSNLPEHPRRWLRRTTVNRAIDTIRARKHPASRFDLPGFKEAPSTPSDQLQILEKDEFRADLAEALKRLTESQRMVLVAKEFEGLSFAQVAVELNMAVSTAKTHYIRALKALGDALRTRWG